MLTKGHAACNVFLSVRLFSGKIKGDKEFPDKYKATGPLLVMHQLEGVQIGIGRDMRLIGTLVV